MQLIFTHSFLITIRPEIEPPIDLAFIEPVDILPEPLAASGHLQLPALRRELGFGAGSLCDCEGVAA